MSLPTDTKYIGTNQLNALFNAIEYMIGTNPRLRISALCSMLDRCQIALENLVEFDLIQEQHISETKKLIQDIHDICHPKP